MHQARKRFGQNFLHDQGVIDRIITNLAPKPDQPLVEIGPGRGALTESLLAAKPTRLDAIEIDRDLIPTLRVQFFKHTELHIHQGDALRFDYSQLYQGTSLRLIGNLPYNITTPLLFHLLKYSHLLEDMHFMLQKEVVDRLCAAPGDSAYGRLSIMMQYHCQTQHLFDVSPEAFTPKPKVQSAIVRLTPRREIVDAANNLEDFATLVRTAFSQRRKTLRNNLKSLLSAEHIKNLGIDPNARAETLSIAAFVSLANQYSQTLAV